MALEIGAKAREQLGELGDRQREPIGGIGERDEDGVLGATAIRVVQLLFPAIELACAPAFERALVGEVIGDAREREQREDVLAELRARKHRADRVVVMARAHERFAVPVASKGLERGRQRNGEGR